MCRTTYSEAKYYFAFISLSFACRESIRVVPFKKFISKTPFAGCFNISVLFTLWRRRTKTFSCLGLARRLRINNKTKQNNQLQFLNFISA